MAEEKDLPPGGDKQCLCDAARLIIALLQLCYILVPPDGASCPPWSALNVLATEMESLPGGSHSPALISSVYEVLSTLPGLLGLVVLYVIYLSGRLQVRHLL